VTAPVSVIVPAYNESAGIEAAVRSLLASDHAVEIIVVDDGSTDGTADLVESLGLPVRVIRQDNAGKPAALNTGIAAASYDLLVMVDGDTVFEPGTVRTLVQPFADPRIGAVSGNAKVINRGGLLGRWQHIEYVVGFNLDRRLFDLGQCMPTVPGAVGAFRRDALVRVGGVSDATLAEDTDLTMAICRDGWRVVYEEDAIAWTEAPASLGALWRQRYRWSYGTMQAMWKHRGTVLHTGAAGRLGRRGLVYLTLFQVLLPLLAPSSTSSPSTACSSSTRSASPPSGWASSPSRPQWACTPSGSTANPRGPCGACLCSSSSTGSSCTSSSSSPSSPRSPEPDSAGSAWNATAAWPCPPPPPPR